VSEIFFGRGFFLYLRLLQPKPTVFALLFWPVKLLCPFWATQLEVQSTSEKALATSGGIWRRS
jgi:hypothetical protein